MSPSDRWYIVKLDNGHCEIMAATDTLEQYSQHWGPFDSAETALARRIGLIRAGKCEPVQPAS